MNKFKLLINTPECKDNTSERKDAPAWIFDHKDNVLKSVAIYGANASGKSNFVKAMNFGRDLLLNAKNGIPAYQKHRLQEECAQKPTRMEFELQHKGKNFAYGFIFNQKHKRQAF